MEPALGQIYSQDIKPKFEYSGYLQTLTLGVNVAR